MLRRLPRWPAVVVIFLTSVSATSADPVSPADNPCAPLPPAAPAQGFAASTNHVGLVDLYYFSAQGATVTYYECFGGRAHRLGTNSAPNEPITPLLGATAWSCDRLTRHYAATAVLPGGVFTRGLTSVQTVSCAHRFRLQATPQIAQGRRARVRVVDRWDLGGLHTRLCLTSPAGDKNCAPLAFAKSDSVATRRFRLHARGRWRVDLQVRRYHVRDAIAVGVKAVAVKAPPALLATGDSTMQGVESGLADDLGDEATVHSDVRPGFAISRDNGWTPIARDQVKRVKPVTTVISLGAAEGFPMKTPAGRTRNCCDEAWIAEYERRVRNAMRVYQRDGKGRVYYLTVVAPREAARATIVSAVNQAIIRAAAGLTGVHVLRMDLLFSPHGYQQTIRYRGQVVDIREPDGVHLNASGTAIEAREVVKAIQGA